MSSHRRTILLAEMLCLIILLCSCGSVKSRNSLISYATKKYGKAEFISEDVSKEDYRKVYLRDKDTGIEYMVSSSMSKILIDGSSFGSYEQTRCNFEELYREYIVAASQSELDELCSQYSMELPFDGEYNKLVFSERTSEDKCVEAGQAVTSVLKQYDVKKLCGWSISIFFGDLSFPAGIYYSDRNEFEVSPVNGIYEYVISEIDPDAEFRFSISGFPEAYWSPEYLTQVKDNPNYKSTTGWFCFFTASDGTSIVACDMSEYGLTGYYCVEEETRQEYR